MAKKVTGYIKLQIPAAKATPAPPVGPALGQHGVNIVQFTKEFNARTADQAGMIIPVVITSGAWKDTESVIQSINEAKRTVTINVEMMGRETPLEIGFAEVKKL